MDEYLAAECDGDGRELFGKDATLTAGYAIGGFMGTIQPQKACGGLQYDPKLQRREYLDHA